MVSIDGKKPWCLCSCSCSSFVPVILFALNGLGVVTKIKTIWQSSENGSFLWRCRVTWQPCGNNGANQLVSKEGISQISSTHLQASLPSWSTSSAEQSLFALPASTKRNGASSGPRRRLAVQSTALFHKALYLQGRSQGLKSCLGWPVGLHQRGREGNGRLSSGKCFLINAIEYASSFNFWWFYGLFNST